MFQELGPFKVVKCIHLLGNNVGFAADCAGKEFRRLEDGWANFPETERAENGATRLFDAIPQFSFRRQQVPCAFDRLELAARLFFCRSEEHTSELQSRRDLVCRLLLEKKNKSRL